MATANDRAVLQTIFNPSTPFGDIPGLDEEEEEEDAQEEGEATLPPVLAGNWQRGPCAATERVGRGGRLSWLGAAPARGRTPAPCPVPVPTPGEGGAGWALGLLLPGCPGAGRFPSHGLPFAPPQGKPSCRSCWSRSGTWSCRGFLPPSREM